MPPRKPITTRIRRQAEAAQNDGQTVRPENVEGVWQRKLIEHAQATGGPVLQQR